MKRRERESAGRRMCGACVAINQKEFSMLFFFRFWKDREVFYTKQWKSCIVNVECIFLAPIFSAAFHY